MNKKNSFSEMLNSTFAVVMLVITMSFMPKSAMGQALQGEFKYAQDGHVYFYLYNPTGYSIPVVWGTSSGDGREYQNQGVMMPYSTFIFGPNSNWIWKKGDFFGLTYPNGQFVYWKSPVTDPVLRQSHPSFKGKGGCRHPNCQCTKYVSAGTGGKCICKHWDYVHND